MSKIAQIKAMEIIDSRATPTIQTTVILDDETVETASIPSVVSIGQYEALELRDNDANRFRGMGVLKAVNFVNSVIGPGLVGADITMQHEIDLWLAKIDNTPNKSRFGANSLLSISMAVAKAAALSQKKPLFLYIAELYAKLGGAVTISR